MKIHVKGEINHLAFGGRWSALRHGFANNNVNLVGFNKADVVVHTGRNFQHTVDNIRDDQILIFWCWAQYNKKECIKKLIERADAIIYETEYCRGVTLKNYPERKKKDEFDQVIYPPSGIKFPKKDPEINDEIILSSCAIWRDWKRIHAAIKSVKEYNKKVGPMKFHIIGPRYGRENTENIINLGTKKRTEFAKWYHQSHAFYYPALNDPSPKVVSEAICHGLPVICTNFHGPREIAGDAAYVIENDVSTSLPENQDIKFDLFKEAIDELKTNYEQWRKKARKRATETLDQNVVAKKLLDVIKRIQKTR